ncbi:carboxypeptidase regulatory-like domain-containing protein [Actinoallomurus soli]|uniref:carboxypeptidase regulatory-like domain-containing protein n=1 Tax=Actinoallomurus soli TaxID=2952535 RepID=UPI00209200DE|nr:carboxypeptidase regulatory-like domain-containing protein [Actinoallomurus soli]MCO5967896.1 carboxypeptidase regulatory-like domain-containing protein [Actinoallomurus soli]
MASADATTTRAGDLVRTLVMGLWLPALFLAGLLFSFLPAFHHPAPHHVKVAVAASPATTAQLQHRLDTAIPGGFTLQPVDSEAEARSAVLNGDVVAAFAPAPHHPQLFGAKADGAAMESVIRQVFTSGAQTAGTTLDFQELVPTRPGDTLGTSPFYLLMACTLPAYFLVVSMQRAVGFSRRAHVATMVGGGAVAAVACYLTGAYGMDAIPQHPLALLYLFLLTQTVSLTSYGLVSFLGPFFPGAAVTLFIMLSVPSSGLTVPVDLLRGFFRLLHPVLPMGNAADALRNVDYFDDRHLGRPTAVLCAWIAAGTALIVLGYVRHLRQLVREAQAGMTDHVPAPPAEDPTVELPEPVALPPRQHHFGTQPPILTGQVSGPAGEPLPDATVTVTDPRGHQLLHTRTDKNGEYAATGFHDGFAIVVAGAPGRQPVATRLHLSNATPVNQDFTLTPGRQAVPGSRSSRRATTIAHDQGNAGRTL